VPSWGGQYQSADLGGPRDRRDVEKRPDVLVYTSSTLDSELDVIGPVRASLTVKASQPYHDLFVRLCDVSPGGRSTNLCDALARVRPGTYPSGPDGSTVVTVELWPTAHRFRAGHRIRLQVSGGSHPRYPRNLGTGEPMLTATELRPVEVAVFHDHDRPSFVSLPTHRPGDYR
jgi:putative CocE/NonD family hydrolase